MKLLDDALNREHKIPCSFDEMLQKIADLINNPWAYMQVKAVLSNPKELMNCQISSHISDFNQYYQEENQHSLGRK